MNIVVVDTVGRRRWLDRPLEERKGNENNNYYYSWQSFIYKGKR
jgi:hypothetical protein